MPQSTSDFVHQLTWERIPPIVREQARRCLLDTIGVAIAARQTDLSRIIYDLVASQFGGDNCALWLDGRRVSASGAALAHGMTIDAVDMHDGYTLTKGHAGAAVVPALFALVLSGVSGKELLTRLMVGYEVALRAGLALHQTACDYHTSGAWNALGSAAVVARSLGLNEAQTRHALGIAEYHGPRSQMMRVIDHPTMLKDGSGWGAMAGVSAGLMAASGFSGAPAITVEGEDVAGIWADLGQRWRMMEQYFKPYAVCRWAQPAITGALRLKQAHDIVCEDIVRITIETFHEAARLTTRHPADTEQAQYSLPFPVAAALVYGKLGADEIQEPALSNPEVLQLADRTLIVESEAFNKVFPAERFARVEIKTRDGRSLNSGAVQTTWEAHAPPANEDLKEKFRQLVRPVLPAGRRELLVTMLWEIEKLDSLEELVTCLSQPPD
jgi:2-methylcitrate dehydratase PrpD